MELDIGERPELWAFNSEDAALGAAFGAANFVMFFSDYALALGFPPRGALPKSQTAWQAHTRGHAVYFFYGALTFVASLKAPALFPVFALLGIAVPFAIMAKSMFELAKHTFQQAHAAGPLHFQAISSSPWAIQFTDVHLTRPGHATAEGDEDGGTALATWAPRVASSKPAFVFVTGDLVDTGDELEWRKAKELLAPIRSAGSRVLLAPGNHDLLAAYGEDASLAIWFSTWLPIAAHKFNARAMRLFLECAAELDPNILLYDGSVLTHELAKMRENLESLCQLFERAQASWSRSDFEAELEQRTAAILRVDATGGNWQAILLHDDVEKFRDKTNEAFFGWEWNRFFPLYVYDPATETLIIVMNTVPDEVPLLESAWGDFGGQQLARVEALAQKFTGRIVLLAHHPIFKWDDEPAPKFKMSDIQRWAGLATARPAADRFAALLSTLSENNREVVVLSGHRHGGERNQVRYGNLFGVRIVEGASLGSAMREVAGMDCRPGSHISVGTYLLRDSGERN
jgi:3',5'-cyclic AMP phosphodiesterase CpdA